MQPFRSLKAILNPDSYHGHGKPPPFFEGWYYKLVDASEQHRLAIIPGFFRGHDQKGDHAFVQVLDGTNGTATYHRFDASEFWAHESDFEVSVGGSKFSAHRVQLDVATDNGTLRGEVLHERIARWPVTIGAPGVMGWYAWVPMMQCYHGIVSLDHKLDGELEFDGRRIDFSGGRGYIEKDWGRSFPAAWIWLQSNHFETPGTCLTASVAIIPWLTRSFVGFLIGVWHGGQLYRFTTYTGATLERLDVADDRIIWEVSDRRRRLVIDARRSAGGVLLGPNEVEMGVRVAETLDAQVNVELTEIKKSKLVLSEEGRNTGLECCGDIDRLISMLGSAGTNRVTKTAIAQR